MRTLVAICLMLLLVLPFCSGKKEEITEQPAQETGSRAPKTETAQADSEESAPGQREDYETDAQSDNTDTKQFPVFLSLKQKVHDPVALHDLPPIVYEKNSYIAFNKLAWILTFEAIDKNEKELKLVTIRGAQRIDVAGKKGEISLESGDWGSTFEIFMSFFEGTGKGPLKFALFDPTDFDEKKTEGREDIQLSNCVILPVILNKK